MHGIVYVSVAVQLGAKSTCLDQFYILEKLNLIISHS